MHIQCSFSEMREMGNVFLCSHIVDVGMAIHDS